MYLLKLINIKFKIGAFHFCGNYTSKMLIERTIYMYVSGCYICIFRPTKVVCKETQALKEGDT